MTDEPIVTITKGQLRMLVDAATFMNRLENIECNICEAESSGPCDEPKHTPDCELEALRKLAE